MKTKGCVWVKKACSHDPPQSDVLCEVDYPQRVCHLASRPTMNVVGTPTSRHHSESARLWSSCGLVSRPTTSSQTVLGAHTLITTRMGQSRMKTYVLRVTVLTLSSD